MSPGAHPLTKNLKDSGYETVGRNLQLMCVEMFTYFFQLKKTKANVVHLQKQYDHEGRKKEREFNKLKDRIHQLLTDKSQEKKVGLDILNLVKRPSGQRATWKTGTAK